MAFEQQTRPGSMCIRSHGMVLRVVAELLGDDGVAEEEGEVGEHVLTGGRNGAGGGKLFGAVGVGHILVVKGCVVLSGFVCLCKSQPTRV